ncbi:hypothetical protein [uncultured Aquabacterium sp.]|jgi:outer membrane murein-binding lipoprotein Lpp|uniref:hypothetical protein n=1 Tax=uncultured Aquabacterium sp. TaxID=158753 RepID=UPI00261F6F19|nr:hypothetical protein [uncultured Aquabacterium sp.]
MNKFALAAAVAASVLASGCASIFNDATQTVTIVASNGQPVQGTVDGKPFQTPSQVQVQRQKASKLISVTSPGCAAQTVADSSVDFKFFGNVITGGLLGSSTDFATERMWKYSDNIIIPCVPTPTPAAAPAVAPAAAASQP